MGIPSIFARTAAGKGRRAGVLAGLLAAALVGLGALGGCATDPTTGDRFVSLFSWEQEAALGLQAADEFTGQFGGPVPDAGVVAYVQEVGSSMLPHVEEGVPDDLPWSFTILNSPVVNAFALPGGQVFITRALAERLENEAQLAGVLGHEIGHVTARHGNQQMSKSVLLQGGLAVGAMIIGAADEGTVLREYGQYGLPVAQVGGQLVLLSYGRDAEYQADELGMRYMARAGYKPSGQLGVMRILARLSEGADRPPVWLSTHPYPQDRIRRIERLLRTTFAQAEADPSTVLRPQAYQQRMLAPLAALPPAPPPQAQEQAGIRDQAAPPSLEAHWAAQPTWCAICRGQPPAWRWAEARNGGNRGVPALLADRWSIHPRR